MTEPSPDLQAAADRLAGLSDEAYESLLARSDAEFAAGEGQPDPIDGYRFDGPPLAGTGPDAAGRADRTAERTAPLRPRDDRPVTDDGAELTREQVR